MATKHELDVEISAEGKVEVRVRGAKGKKCLNYVQLFGKVGKVADQQPTTEFYEPEPGVGIVDSTRTRLE